MRAEVKCTCRSAFQWKRSACSLAKLALVAWSIQGTLASPDDASVSRGHVPTAPEVIPRVRSLQPEGKSLRDMLSVHGSDAQQRTWRVFLDEASGHPYYWDPEADITQWENPFGSGAELGGFSFDFESWRLYDTFDFDGLFDDLTALRHRRSLPRTGMHLESVTQIAAIAGVDFDIAQAQLEVHLFKLEMEAYGDEELPGRGEWLRPELRWSPDTGLSEPPQGVTAAERVRLAGAWNDLANMWYARGEWETMFDCWRKSLFWNPEQTSSLLNMASVLVRLGFEDDANIVMNYYDDVGGGSQGGWSPEKEQVVRTAIARGLQAAALSADGLTSGNHLLLHGALDDAAYVARLQENSPLGHVQSRLLQAAQEQAWAARPWYERMAERVREATSVRDVLVAVGMLAVTVAVVVAGRRGQQARGPDH